MILGFLLAAGVGSSHAAFHPTGADLYAEIPDAGAAINAYANAPFVRMVGSEGAANIGALVKDIGFDIQSMLGSLLPVADPARPDDRWWPWSAAQKISFSATGLEASTKHGAPVSAWMICDFKTADAAMQAELALAAMGGIDAVPAAPITIAGLEIPVNTIGSPLGVIPGTAWTTRIDTRLIAGVGAAQPAEFVARSADPEGGLHSAWNSPDATKHFGAPTGVTALEILADMDDVPLFLSESAALSSVALFLAPFLSASGRWRIELQGDRFITNAVYEPRGTAAQLFSVFGAGSLSPKTLNFLPPDAVGTWVTTVDAARAESAVGTLFASALGDAPIAEAGATEPRMADGLGSAMATSLLPFQSLMQPTPRIVLALELTDPTKFQAGFDAWLARAKAATPTLVIERKPYRKVPTIVIGGGKEEPEAGGGGGSPFGGISIEPTRVAVAVLADRVLFTSAPSVVRNEIKRIQDAETATTHEATQKVARGSEAVEVSTMDWAAFLSKIYDGLRGVLPMLAQGRSEPIDLEKLPAAEQLFAPFRPSSSWARRDGVRWVVHSESSFGPETPIALAALGFLGMRASRLPTANATGSEVAPGTASTSSTAAPSTAPTTPTTNPEDPRALTLSALREVRTALAIYRSQFGRAPAGTAELLQKTDAYPDGFLKSGKVPKDGWGRELVYVAPADGSSYVMRSLGPDGIDQDGAGDDVRLP